MFILCSLRILRCVIIMTVGLWAANAVAQVRCVIVDKETGTPIRNVKLYADNKELAVTNYLGQIVADTTFRSATLSHPDYLSRLVAREELRDTLWMLPKAIRLDEVVVWGKYRPGITAIIAGATQGLEAYAPPGGLVSFDFFSLFQKKPLNKKARKRNKEILENWDSTPDNTQDSENQPPPTTSEK